MDWGVIIQHIVFFVFAITLVLASLMVVLSRNPVRGVLFLVLCFVCTAVLWILLQAEFLGLILVLVYVGAVMTLFLFVVMMLDIDIVPEQQGFVRYLPLGLIVVAILVGMMIWVVAPSHFHYAQAPIVPSKIGVQYSNVYAIGSVLYTEYLLPLELAGVLLLVAMISAISLAFRGRRQTSKAQVASQQISVRKSDRIRIIKMPSSKKSGNKDDEGEQ